MAKIKIHELAKEIKIPSKEIVHLLKEQGSDIKNHMSNIEETEIKLVRQHFAGKGTVVSDTETERKKDIVKQTIVEKETALAPKNDTKEMSENKERNKIPLDQSLSGQNSEVNQRPQTTQKTQSLHQNQHNGGQRSNQSGNYQNRGGQGGGYQNRSGQGQSGNYQNRGDQSQGGGYQNRSGQGQSGNYQNRGDQSQGGGYQNRSGQSQGGGYQNRTDGTQSGGYQNRSGQGQSGNYQNRGSQGQSGGYQNRTDGTQSGGYQNRSGQGQSGGYQNRSGQGQSGGYQNRSGQGQSGGYQNRTDGTQGGGYQNRSGQGQSGGYQNRGGQGQSGGYQNRSGQGQSGGYQNRTDGTQSGGYQNRSGQGQSSGGYQNRSGQGQSGGYQNRTGQGQSSGGYQNRTGQGQSSGGYQNRSGQGQSGGYQNRTGQGQSSGGYQNRGGQTGGERRPYSNNNQADRRPGGSSFSGQRPGQGGPGFDKDKDGGYGNRNFSDRKSRTDGKGEKTIKSELVNELTKEQRAAAFSDKSRDRNRDRNKEKSLENDKKNAKSSKKDPNRKGAFIMPKPQPVQVQKEDEVRTIIIPEVVTIKSFSEKLKRPAAMIIKKLFLSGKMVSINSEISFEEAEEMALEYNCIAEKEVQVNVVEELLKEEDEDESLFKKRPPVVCVMGHVDHGKTSLLDAIRETNVTAKEAGGITQHIGAYMVEINGEQITFLDTPGHEAFTSMRMRGAKSTDIAILVVAADDGVMPQTVEAINHAKAANVQIIVAVNKMDKPGANLDRVKQELTEHALVAEDWGGDTIFVPVSAKTKEGIENLLEMVLLTAEIADLKANSDRKARGIVIEAELDKGRGPVATILVQKGTLQVGDNVAIGAAHGKVRAMMDDKGRRVKEAYPSMPVEVLGLNGVPDAGEIVISVKDEKEARTIAEAFISQGKEKLLADTKARLSLDGLFSQIKAGSIKELNLIIKADVQGSVEAVKQSLTKLNNEEVIVRAIHGGVGAINESDVNLASASNAIIIGFNVKPDNTAKEIADREKVEVKLYRVIYQAIEDVEAAMKGMLKPIFAEKVIGHAEIRQTFKASGLGVIAGSYVLDGKIVRGCSVRITREETLIYEGPLSSLKRFKDDVKEVATGYECGLTFEKFDDLQEFDKVEFYVMEEVPR